MAERAALLIDEVFAEHRLPLYRGADLRTI
jgi:hypothetical protein